MNISKFALDRPVSTSMAILSVIVLGLLSVNRIPLIFLPDISRPYLRIQANYQGSNPEEIERLIRFKQGRPPKPAGEQGR